MKVLLDSCVWGHARTALESAGHDVVCAADWRADPGDVEILARATAEGRILVTLDKDFGELAIVQGLAHAGIVRLADLSAREQGPVCVRVLAQHGVELATGAIVTVSPGRVRIRPADR
jgi:predicted nuclease of predicted toxin-antitoxin system